MKYVEQYTFTKYIPIIIVGVPSNYGSIAIQRIVVVIIIDTCLWDVFDYDFTKHKQQEVPVIVYVRVINYGG